MHSELTRPKNSYFRVYTEKWKFNCMVDGCNLTFKRYFSFRYHYGCSQPSIPQPTQPAHPEYKEHTTGFANDPYDRVVIPSGVLELDVLGLDTPDVSAPVIVALATNARRSFEFGMQQTKDKHATKRSRPK